MLLKFLQIVFYLPPEDFSLAGSYNPSVTLHPIAAQRKRDFLFLLL